MMKKDVLENYVNLPLTLMLNEVILTVLFILAGVSVLMSLCGGPSKIGGIFTGVRTKIYYNVSCRNKKKKSRSITNKMLSNVYKYESRYSV